QHRLRVAIEPSEIVPAPPINLKRQRAERVCPRRNIGCSDYAQQAAGDDHQCRGDEKAARGHAVRSCGRAAAPSHQLTACCSAQTTASANTNTTQPAAAWIVPLATAGPNRDAARPVAPMRTPLSAIATGIATRTMEKRPSSVASENRAMSVATHSSAISE